MWKKGKVELHLDELPFGVYCEICSTEKEIDKIVSKLNIKNVYRI